MAIPSLTAILCTQPPAMYDEGVLNNAKSRTVLSLLGDFKIFLHSLILIRLVTLISKMQYQLLQVIVMGGTTV